MGLLDAGAAWVRWRNLLGAHGIIEGPAWRAIDRYGHRPRVDGLHRNSIAAIIGRRAAGLDDAHRWGGHSLRRGFATEAIAAGVPLGRRRWTRLLVPVSSSTHWVGSAAMAGTDDLERRVAALEERVRDLTGRMRASEQDAAAARVLAGAADRDVAEVRSEIREFREQNTRVLNAMRDDLTDVRARVDSGFAEMRGRLDQTAAGQEPIAILLTRPIRGAGRAGPRIADYTRKARLAHVG